MMATRKSAVGRFVYGKETEKEQARLWCNFPLAKCRANRCPQGSTYLKVPLFCDDIELTLQRDVRSLSEARDRAEPEC